MYFIDSTESFWMVLALIYQKCSQFNEPYCIYEARSMTETVSICTFTFDAPVIKPAYERLTIINYLTLIIVSYVIV